LETLKILKMMRKEMKTMIKEMKTRNKNSQPSKKIPSCHQGLCRF
jgi:hypothetical protein